MVRAAGYRSLATSRPYANLRSTDAYRLGRVALLRGTDQVTFGRICTADALRRMRLKESLQGAAKQIMGNALYDRFRAVVLRQS